MFVSLDLETTGFHPEKDQIIEFGAVKFDLTGAKETLQFLINPGMKIPEVVTHITKIKDQDVVGAPKFSEKIKEIEEFIGDLPIVGHNIKFDTDFLKVHGVKVEAPEYDTHTLSRIVLPDVPSHSLETLSQILNLEHTDKHRALDDSIAAMELFLVLVGEFKKFDKSLIDEIINLSERSKWEFKEFLKELRDLELPENLRTLDQKENTKEKLANAKIGEKSSTIKDFDIEEAKKTSKDQKVKIVEKVKTILESDTNKIFEIFPPFGNLIKNLSEEAGDQTYIALPYDLFREISPQINDKIAKIDVPRNYLSPKKLEEFKNKKFYKNYEITALIKFLVWSKKTKTGLLSEVSLHGEEKKTINKVNIENDLQSEEIFFQKALEKDKNAAAICSHNYLLENPVENGNLIIVDIENFNRSLQRQSSIFLKIENLLTPLAYLEDLFPENQNLKELISLSENLFGIIDSFFPEFGEDDNFYKKTLDFEILETKKWENLQKISKGLLETSKNLGEINNEETRFELGYWKEKLGNLVQIFLKTDLENNYIWFEKTGSGSIRIQQRPYTVKNHLLDLLNKQKSFKILSENIDLLDEGEFAKKHYNLPDEIELEKLPQFRENLQIFGIEDIYEKNDPAKIQFITKYFQKHQENIAILFNSKRDLKNFTIQLAQNKLNVFSQLTGSMGKIESKFHESQDPAIVIMTINSWPNFQHHQDIDTLIINKIPFHPPSDPEIITASKHADNPFINVQLPKALVSIKQSINRLNTNSKAKKAIITDPRLVRKSYCQSYIHNLKAMGNLEILDSTDLL